MTLVPTNTSMEMHQPSSIPQPISIGKRAEVMAILRQIPEANEVQFEPIQTEKNRPPKLQIPANINVTDPYQIFSLFFY
jgi:hypothetical protein